MTAPNATPSIRQIALGDFDNEVAITRRVLERVPDEHWDWRPHAKSTPLGKLATHVAGIFGLHQMVLTRDTFDAAGPRPAPPAATNREELLRLFDDLSANSRATLETVTDDAWLRTWSFRFGERTVMEQPRVSAFRTLGLSHIAHHRGQLSVYLRLLDVSVPSIYGPSADEPV